MGEQRPLTNSLGREEASDFFDPELMGALPDAVPETSVDVWQSLLDLVTEHGCAHQ